LAWAPAPKHGDKRAEQPIAAESRRLPRTIEPTTLSLAPLKWLSVSLAIIALATGAPVLPATSWREAGGRHVLRFETPIVPIEIDDTGEAIRRNTRAYNAELERLILVRPEQWY
jgi:uncharacterized protein (DUF1684 family)